ncbi:hypothetical protein [Streptomyces sp. MUSC 14]|uniref:hypothetical protein n=1 Tax=Streptomyces sp. MUSC 14 TaxID=1354889 RepID=UPI001160BE52|nr:hypothetical protein [Streptomyces sp. MUSC 14]
MTSIEPAHRAAPANESEREQMEAAFRAALERLPQNTGFPHAVRELARPLFEVGWISGVRTGHTGPALADVPLPPHTFNSALSKLCAVMDAEAGPSVGQLVSYHGSQERAHGRYWVTRIERELDRRGRESVYYRLSDYRDGVFVTALSGVHAWSVTALPQHWQRDTP